MRANRKSIAGWYFSQERVPCFGQRSQVAQPAEPGIPLPPATARGLVHLQFLLASPVADLTAISNVIRNDIGLAVHALRWAGVDAVDSFSGGLFGIEDLIVLLGLNRLRAISQTATVLSSHPKGRAGFRTFERFSMHARLTALIAEQLAKETVIVRWQDAYLSGLLRHIGALPLVLSWNMPEFEQAESGEIGCAMAKSWSLPEILWPVIAGDREPCPASRLSLFDIVSTADAHAFRLEMGYE
jgi:HD-like signal output (HDOD) protein